MHWCHVSITTTPCWGSRLVVLCARVVLAERVGALSPSVSARARASPAVWHAGVDPLACCMLGDGACGSASLTPNTRGRPSVMSYGLLSKQFWESGRQVCPASGFNIWSTIQLFSPNWNWKDVGLSLSLVRGQLSTFGGPVGISWTRRFFDGILLIEICWIF